MNAKNLKQRQIRCTLIHNMFTSLEQPICNLIEAEYHSYVQDVIKSDPIIANRKKLAELYGTTILTPLIKTKKYRKSFTDFIDGLRASKNFRER
jgi:cyanate lyase